MHYARITKSLRESYDVQEQNALNEQISFETNSVSKKISWTFKKQNLMTF